MLIPTATEMRELLTSKIDLIAKSCEMSTLFREQFRMAKLPTNDFSISPSGVLKTYFNDFILSVSIGLTAQYSNGLPVQILAPAIFDLSANEIKALASNGHRSSEQISSLLLDLINTIKFAEIESYFHKECSNLLQRGLSQIANDMCKKISFDYAEKYASLRGRFVYYEIRYIDSRYEVKEKLAKIQSCIEHIENNSDVRFGSAILDILSTLNKMNSMEEIESRTRFGTAIAFEIVCYKNKYEMKFSMLAFEALLAFISMHASSTYTDAAFELLSTTLLDAA